MAENLFNFDDIESIGSTSPSDDIFNFDELGEVPVKPLETAPDLSGQEPEYSSDPELEERLQKRKFEVQQSRQAMESGDIGLIQGETQILGKGGAGAVFDFLGHEIGQAGKGLLSIIPDSVKDPVKLKLAQTWDDLSNSEFGKVVDYYVDSGGQYLDRLEKADPQKYKTMESMVNLGMMFAPAKAKANAEPVRISKPVVSLKAKARRYEKAFRGKYADDFVKPYSTKAIRTEEAKRTVAGTFVDKPQLSAHETRMSQEVLRHPSINSGNSLQQNLNNAIKANNKLGNQLRKDIVKTGQPISENVSGSISARVNKLIQDDPMFVGDTGRAAAKRVGQANKIIAKHPKTAEGMLNARQEFDDLVRATKGDKGFTDMGNGLNVATKEIRSEMNDIIHRNVGVNAKNSLRRQSLMFDTINNVAVKAGEQHSHAVGRVIQNVGRVLQAKQMLIATGLLFGAGAVTSMSGAMPYLVGTLAAGGLGIAGKKIIMSPKTRKGLVELLSLTDKAIKQTRNAAMRTELKADRTILVSIIKEAQLSKEETK